MIPGIYARYSSSNQRAASIEDQLRDNFALAARLGLGEPMIYTDSEISGERRDRPGYVRLLRDAQAALFQVLIVWDLKRLSRAEDLPQLLARFRFWGVRVITCDGFDSDQEGADIRGWVDGMIGNKYLRDLAKATHRGLTGRAMEGASAGGLRTKLLPQASASGNIHIGTIAGKLNGVIPATTPSGCISE